MITSVNEDAPGTERMVLDGCTIRGNSGDPAVVGLSGYAEFRNTKIVDNVVKGDVHSVVNIGADGTTPTVEMVNVLLADNETQGPHVVNNSTGSTMLMNVTLVGNCFLSFLAIQILLTHMMI